MAHLCDGPSMWDAITMLSMTAAVRNQLSATRWQATPRILPVQTMPPITFHEPHYVNTIKLFGHGPGTGLRKAPSHQMNRTYSEVLRTTLPRLDEYPRLRWELPINEISALGRELERSSIGRVPVDHQATITTPMSAIRSTKGYAEKLAFTPPPSVPRHLIPSIRNGTDY